MTALAGDGTGGFDALYRREVRGLTMVATALTGSPEVAAELVHEAFLRAHRHWPKVRELERPGAWVRRVLVNLAVDAGRRRRRERAALARWREPDEAVEPARPDERYWSAVRALPERQRVAVVLRYVDDRSVNEVAELMGVAPGTVTATLSNARAALARALGIEEEDR